MFSYSSFSAIVPYGILGVWLHMLRQALSLWLLPYTLPPILPAPSTCGTYFVRCIFLVHHSFYLFLSCVYTELPATLPWWRSFLAHNWWYLLLVLLLLLTLYWITLRYQCVHYWQSFFLYLYILHPDYCLIELPSARMFYDLVSQTLLVGYPLSWLSTLHPCLGCGGW